MSGENDKIIIELYPGKGETESEKKRERKKETAVTFKFDTHRLC